MCFIRGSILLVILHISVVLLYVVLHCLFLIIPQIVLVVLAFCLCGAVHKHEKKNYA